MPSGNKKQVPLRISAPLYDKLMQWAADDFRSLNGQIEYLLSECVRRREKSEALFAAENANNNNKTT